jgi:CheY-like chemotaxis protein
MAEKVEKKAKILVVEDDFMNMILVKEILALYGYEVVEAGNGKEAVEKAAKEKPDLILMDINLPEMDGVAATKKIKAEESTKKIPVFALTASVMKGDAEKFLSEGFDGYLAKPIETKKLIESIESGLAQEKAEG